MSNSSNPPFQINQEVVCIKDHSNGLVKKNDRYIIQGVSQCECGKQLVTVGVKTRTGYEYGVTTCRCGADAVSVNGFAWLGAVLFAPIQESYSDATADILEKFPITEERPDKVLIPETTVNN